MTPLTIHCQDCGHEYETIRRNTKRCSVCQLIRSTTFVGTRRRKCMICEESFAPLDNQDALCGQCTYTAKRPGAGECSFCHENKPFVRVDVAVCHGCARDPAKRALFRQALGKKRKARQDDQVKVV